MLEVIFKEHEKEQSLNVQANVPAKKPNKNRYFIELLVREDHEVTRALIDGIRAHKAHEFISILRDWMRDSDLKDDVSSLSVTAMGQVMIVCTHRVIDFIRAQDMWAIAHIRSADQIGALKNIAKR
jgi:hypothetical protein